MNLFLNHKSQAFYITSFLFSLLFFGFLYSTSWFKVTPQQESFSLTMQQFITQSTQNPLLNTQKSIESIPKEQKDISHKKSIKTKKHKPKPMPQPHQSLIASSNTSTPTNAIPKDSIETLTFGKDNHPFLKAVKKAIDSNVNYPRQARKMRMQGEVLVEFLWTKHRILKDLKVRKSSGYPILDENALKTIQKASSHFPTHTNNAYLQIPIVFTLRN
ncbi:energy transducer TonB [Helicobacter turcicus]|uniref:Energy transducer TonB n=1 Tax=Helicobacter turcicus TaxID=2867412 RepID=A0ABS7JPJ2_9HELI|nr:energy transducer TonB [Helicobacter turcicus]MBX7491316.1 energy transducer TonB [Helicobacter turcicus]MBX7546197.1 energy transducer TonB [Helicobacter turcicus]